MNTATLKRASERGGPVVLTAGVTSLLVVLLTAAHDRPPALAQPQPTATTTVTAPAPSLGSSPPVAASPVVVAVFRPAVRPSTPGGVAPSGPTPRPSPTSSPTSTPPGTSQCGGQSPAVLSLAACLSIGGK